MRPASLLISSLLAIAAFAQQPPIPLMVLGTFIDNDGFEEAKLVNTGTKGIAELSMRVCTEDKGWAPWCDCHIAPMQSLARGPSWRPRKDGALPVVVAVAFDDDTAAGSEDEIAIIFDRRHGFVDGMRAMRAVLQSNLDSPDFKKTVAATISTLDRKSDPYVAYNEGWMNALGDVHSCLDRGDSPQEIASMVDLRLKKAEAHLERKR